MGDHIYSFFSVYEFKLMEVIKLTLFRNKRYVLTETFNFIDMIRKPMQFFRAPKCSLGAL